MKLSELKNIIDVYIQHDEKRKDADVLINLNEPSVGGGAFSPVKRAYMGFDWEYNQFRLVPTDKICHVGMSPDDAKKNDSSQICLRQLNDVCRALPKLRREIEDGCKFLFAIWAKDCGRACGAQERL